MLEKIDSYFNHNLSKEECQLFEAQLATDKVLADEVAFYLHTRIAAHEIAKEQRKLEFEELRKKLHNNKVRLSTWITGIAASVIIAFISWVYVQNNQNNVDEIADAYIQTHFENLPVKMDGNTDSLQMGLRLFNKFQYQKAQVIFNEMLKRKPNNAEVLKVSGITALKSGDNITAISRFQELSKQDGLFSNPGKFYEALVLLKVKPVNAEAVKKLLNEVVKNDLEGKDTAIELLKEL